jgi:anti-sigma B factor antagonist
MLSPSDVKTIQLQGVLTASTAPELVEQFNHYVAIGGRYMLIDLAQCGFVDSSGLGTLVSLHTKLRLAGGKLYLCGLQEQARCLFEIADMDTLFEIFPSEQDFSKVMFTEAETVLHL